VPPPPAAAKLQRCSDLTTLHITTVKTTFDVLVSSNSTRFIPTKISPLDYIPFAISMVWTQPTDHVSDCCFCLISITGVIANSKHTVQYPNLPSAMRPVLHSVELPVPKPPTNMTLSDNE
jgi:hypothetical protein